MLLLTSAICLLLYFPLLGEKQRTAGSPSWWMPGSNRPLLSCSRPSALSRYAVLRVPMPRTCRGVPAQDRALPCPPRVLQSLPCACCTVQSPGWQQIFWQPPVLPCLRLWFLSHSQILPVSIAMRIYRGSSWLPAAALQCTNLENPHLSCCFLPSGQSWLLTPCRSCSA